MCGIFFARSIKNKIDDKIIQKSLSFIEERGPDKTFFVRNDTENWVLVNTILNITQEEGDIYHPIDEGRLLSYNGEIYGWEQTGSYKDDYSDTKSIDNIIEKDVNDLFLHSQKGFFAFIKGIKNNNQLTNLLFGSDLTGEKNLYWFFDDSNIVISSSPRSIYVYLNLTGISPLKVDLLSCQSYLFSRNIIYNPGSFIKGIDLLPNGRIYNYNLINHTFEYDNSNTYIDKLYQNYKDNNNIKATEESIINDIKLASSIYHKKNLACTFSGGIDSAVVAAYVSELNPILINSLISLTFGSKDNASLISTTLYERIRSESNNHICFDVNVESYGLEFDHCYKRILSPLPTHSYPSFSLICRILKSLGTKVLFVGDGADELYNGYEAYNHIKLRDSSTSISPYSSFNCEKDSQFYNLFKTIKNDLDRISSIERIKERLDCDPIKATWIASKYLDFTLNLRSVGLLCGDIIGSSHGIEVRAPLISTEKLATLLFGSQAKSMYSLTLNKPDLRVIFSQIYGHNLIQAKQGFSGFPNEYALSLRGEKSIPLLSEDLLGLNISPYNKIYNKREQWKILNLENFLLNL